jgi:hypothetical protein
MECMAYINHDSAKAGARYQVFGDLRISQRQPLSHKGLDDRYNVSNTSFKSGFFFSFELQFIKCYFWKICEIHFCGQKRTGILLGNHKLNVQCDITVGYGSR